MAANGQSVERAYREERRSTEHSAAVNTAASGMGQGFDPGELASREFVDTLSELDVERDLPDEHPQKYNVERYLAAESSKQLGLANIQRKDWTRATTMDKARCILAKMELARPAGMGSRCTGATRRRMVGDGEATILTGDMERQLDAAYRTIALKRSQSIGGWLMTKIADMSVFTRSEGFESESSGKGGILSRVTGFLRS